jgi:hypothetical protein
MGLLPVSRIAAIHVVLKRALAAVAMTAVGTSLSCEQDMVAVNNRIFVKDGDVWRYNGGGCMTAQLGGSNSLAPTPSGGGSVGTASQGSDFEVSEGGDGSDVVVQVFSDNQLLLTRR